MGVRGVESQTFRTSDPPFVKKYLDEKRENERMRIALVM